MQVSTGKLKQDIIVADESAAIKLTLWEDDVGNAQEKNSYELKQMMVKTFNRAKLLSYPKLGGTIVEIDDIGNVTDHDETTLNPGSKDFINAKVGGVSSLNKHNSCLKQYASKVITEIPSKYAIYTNTTCHLFQSLADA